MDKRTILKNVNEIRLLYYNGELSEEKHGFWMEFYYEKLLELKG